jgi:L-ascorbate metabolism protein UlaG (beta-lactamase superfamily)
MTFILPKEISLTYLGHSTFHLLTPGGQRVLIDPWVQGNPRCPADKKDVGPLDRMLITHGHFDHIGDAVLIGKATKAVAYANFETSTWLGGKGVENTNPMNKGGTIREGGIAVTMVHADHSCGITDGDQLVYGGEAGGYIVELENGFKIYHAGDTAVFGDMRLIAEIYKPDLALLPIGDRFVMSPREAAHATRLLGVAAVVPMHFATFPMLTGTPEDFRTELDALGVRADVIVLEPGEALANG